MQHPSLLRSGLLALSLGLAALPGWADDDCSAPMDRWQSREAVRQMAAQQGWQIQRLKIDDGCYEIRGTDTQGRRFKAKIDPETLKVVKLKQRDHRGDGKHDRDRDRDRDHGPARDPGAAAQPERSPPPGAATPAPAPLFTPGTAPRGQVG